MRKSFLATLILISVIVLCPFSSLAADEESLARQAEQAGKLREAVTHYVNALQSVSEGSSKDRQLREKIISLVQKLTPPPAVPEEAQKYLGRGQAAVEKKIRVGNVRLDRDDNISSSTRKGRVEISGGKITVWGRRMRFVG